MSNPTTTPARYETTNHEALRFEMAEKTDKQLRACYYNNAPGATLQLRYGAAALARHREAWIEMEARREAKGGAQ